MAVTQSLGEVEATACKELESKLLEPGELSRKAFDLVSGALAAALEMRVREVRPSLAVATALLVRLGNDLRCCGLLALRGYPVQAVCLVATIYEVAYAVAKIGSDDALAREWLQHETPLTLPAAFRDTLRVTTEVLRKFGVPDAAERSATHYQVYSQACMAKHANPLLQTQYGIERIGTDVVAACGPQTSEVAVRATWWALGNGAGLVALATAAFVQSHVPNEKRTHLVGPLKEILDATDGVRKDAIKRWGNDDPFPGKWRAALKSQTR